MTKEKSRICLMFLCVILFAVTTAEAHTPSFLLKRPSAYCLLRLLFRLWKQPLRFNTDKMCLLLGDVADWASNLLQALEISNSYSLHLQNIHAECKLLSNLKKNDLLEHCSYSTLFISSCFCSGSVKLPVQQHMHICKYWSPSMSDLPYYQFYYSICN